MAEATFDSVIKDSEARMTKSLEQFNKELATIRSTRATPSMLDHISVEYYGSHMPVNQVATISTPEARILMITPFDKGAMQEIEKAIMKSDLNLTPQNDGSVIRLILPELSMERRQELVKQVKSKLEETRVALRNVRRDGMDSLKKITGKSEDEIKGAQEKLQQLTDKSVEKAEAAAAVKEKGILTV